MRYRKMAQILSQPLGVPVFSGKVRPEGNHRLPRGGHEIIQLLALSRPRPHVAGEAGFTENKEQRHSDVRQDQQRQPQAIDACGVREIITAWMAK